MQQDYPNTIAYFLLSYRNRKSGRLLWSIDMKTREAINLAIIFSHIVKVFPF